MRKLMMAAALVASAALGTGCASGYEGGTDLMAAPAAEAEDGRATIEVVNNDWSDVRVHLLRNGMRTRLGTVLSMGREEFSVPAHLLAGGDIRLLAEPIGGDAAVASDPIVLAPGETLEWRLAHPLELSSVWLR